MKNTITLIAAGRTGLQTLVAALLLLPLVLAGVLSVEVAALLLPGVVVGVTAAQHAAEHRFPRVANVLGATAPTVLALAESLSGIDLDDDGVVGSPDVEEDAE